MNPWELAAGEALPKPLILGPISRSDIVRYQGASGDFQPIHHDEPFAKAAGYDAPLVVGLYPAGVLCAWAAQIFGATSVRRCTIRFNAMVWPGDTLTAAGVVTECDGAQRRLALTLTNAEGEVVLGAAMTIEKHPDSV